MRSKRRLSSTGSRSPTQFVALSKASSTTWKGTTAQAIDSAASSPARPRITRSSR